jgi:hypothetical protein
MLSNRPLQLIFNRKAPYGFKRRKPFKKASLFRKIIPLITRNQKSKALKGLYYMDRNL